jgi:E3 ubiquitin-protein ligase BRE1
VLQARFEASEQKLDQLRDANLEFRDAVLVEARTEAEALRQQVGKKDTDLARLRGQRDEMNAELTERRQREADRMRFADEMEGLCKARQERITLLASEVRRLKGKLAAQHGAEGYLAFLRGDGGIDGDYVRDLEERGKAANNKIAALSEQLEKLAEGGAAAAAAESEFRVELEVARRSLAKYERVLGPNADPSVADLTQRLQDETDGKTQLELRLSEAEASTDALYAEVEGISKQWEALEHTLRTKVFELKDAELRMGRLQTEKAKADNKFYQAMRSKEAIEAECKTAQRSVDKQLKLLERAQEVERALTAQLVSISCF